MSAFLLYHRSSRPTGEVIGEALGIEHGTSAGDRQRCNPLIRWGSGAAVALRPEAFINGREGITRASDKLASLQYMREGGVPVPNWAEIPTALRAPMLGRNRHHSRGSDIVLCMQQSDALRAERDYFVEYIPTAREFRIHVFGGRIIRSAEKTLTNPEDACSFIRNHEHGCTFRRPRQPLGVLQEQLAITAVQSLRLDFGAVDMIIADDGHTYVLEVNTAPACSPRTAQEYVTALAESLTGMGVECNPNLEILERLRENNADDLAD